MFRADRLEVLDAIQAANLKVLRLFISETFSNFKNTGSIYMPDVEPQTVGVWDDTQLEAIDQLMVEAHDRNIKLTIALHDRYQLGCWGNDAYVDKYHLPAVDCSTGKASDNNVEFWYSDKNCISDFENRIRHILEHRNARITGSPAWKDLSSHIFSFNIQNEGQGHLNGNIAPHPSWWCDRAKFMRNIMGQRGGNEFPNSDIPENWACAALDLVNIHSYSGVAEFRSKGPAALQRALNANKLMLFEEFGASGSGKANEIAQHIAVFNDLRVPWLPWQISKPGNGQADFEFWTNEETYGVVRDGSNAAAGLNAAQGWSI
uniref:mannan endo-1,4-beta-mannosidase n=1 Tax=Bionectria ochroleuca TaxID=29856 RepID=A0A8H7TQ56_BIOOC